MSSTRRQLRHYGLPALALLCALVVAALSPATLLWLDVGSAGDDQFVEGFYPAELNEHESFRWSQGEATLTFPAERSGRYQIELALAVVEPAGRSLHISCGDDRQSVALDDRLGNSVITFGCRTPGEEIRVHLNVPALQIGGDEDRALGVSVRDVRVAADDWQGKLLAKAGVAVAVFATVSGVWLGGGALGFRRVRIVLAGALVVAWFVFALVRPAWMLAAVAGPGSLLTLIGGAVAWNLARGLSGRARLVALLALFALLVSSQQSLALTLPSRWVDGDLAAVRLMPWLAGGAIVIAAWSGSRYLAVAGGAVGLGTVGLPVVAKLLVDRWALALAIPDWTDQASVAGAVYVLAVAVIIVVGIATLDKWRELAVIPIVALGLAALLGWRVAVMDFNGDEPHYYVTARSIGADRDLELLNNYHEESYRRNTISPDGNIAVVRDASADRYSTLFPPDAGDSRYRDGERNPIRLEDGSLEWLPPLESGTSRTLLFTGECEVDAVQVSAPDRGPRDLRLYLRNAAGLIIWESEESFDNTTDVRVDGACEGEPASLTIESSSGPIVAYAVDERSGLLIIPGRGAGEVSTFGSLPRDRYASRDVFIELAIHNPEALPIEATLSLVGHDGEHSDIVVEIPADGTTVTRLQSQGYEALRVHPFDRLVVQGIGHVWAGSYALPEPMPLGEWRLSLPADGRHDSGSWVSLVNDGTTESIVQLDDGDDDTLVALCGGCLETVLLAAGEDEREVVVHAEGGQTWASAVQYQERTGSLHFDPGLPFLAAPFASFASPKTALVVPVLAALAMLPGLVVLLKRIGVRDQLAARCAAGMLLLAPLSPYAIRLYTEIVAACLLVWALVCWDAAGRQARYLLPLAAIALALPVLHGRFIVFSAAFGVLIALRGLQLMRGLNRRRVVYVAGSMLAFGVLATVMLQLTVGLRQRATASYIATNWADVGLVGVLLDRGSGLLPFAPWLVLAWFVPRPLQPLQRMALGLALLQLAAVIVRAGGWQTWGAPARYILPVVPLLALLVAPAIQRLWDSGRARPIVGGLVGWGMATTFMLHWLPLSGYVLEGRYLIDEAWQGVGGISPLVVFPEITPSPGSFMVGTALAFGLLAGAGWLLVTSGHAWPRTSVGAQFMAPGTPPKAVPRDSGLDEPNPYE